MKARYIVLLITALALTVGCIGALVYFITTVRDEIDITDSAAQVFSDFERKALDGPVDALTKKEAKMAEHWGEVSALCYKTMEDIVNRYALEVCDHETALTALEQYQLFPVTSGQIASYKDRVEVIKNGRAAYEEARTVNDDLQAALLLAKVDPMDTVRYNDAKSRIAVLIDPDSLEEHINEMLSRYEISESLSLLNSISAMWSKDNSIELIIENVESYKTSQEETYTYKGSIEVLSVRNLMAFPETVYAPDSKYANSYDSALITPGEFADILDSLYENDYILIPIETLASAESLAGVKVPSGKTPFVLVIEDLCYPTANKGSGVVEKLALDGDGRLCSVTDNEMAYDNESVMILDDFAKAHPDFVFKGARGCISLTGYDGVFGYRLDTEESVNAAKAVAEHLRSQGWTFACNSYTYADMQKASIETLREDTDTWLAEIGGIVGETSTYIWPYGSSVRSGEKHTYLYDAGFRVYCGMGIAAYRGAEPDSKGVFADRKPLNGYSLRNHRDEYLHLFDSEEVLDPIRPQKDEAEE